MGKTGIVNMHTVHKFWLFTLNIQLLAEVNGPNDSKTIMVNPYVAFGCTNRFGSCIVFHKIPCDNEIQK